MKPLKLTMQAFLSYKGKETIDFSAFEGSLFLVDGETGAGKTSIFASRAFKARRLGPLPPHPAKRPSARRAQKAPKAGRGGRWIKAMTRSSVVSLPSGRLGGAQKTFLKA